MVRYAVTEYVVLLPRKGYSFHIEFFMVSNYQRKVGELATLLIFIGIGFRSGMLECIAFL